MTLRPSEESKQLPRDSQRSQSLMIRQNYTLGPQSRHTRPRRTVKALIAFNKPIRPTQKRITMALEQRSRQSLSEDISLLVGTRNPTNLNS